MKYLLQREMQKFDKLHDKRFNKLDIPRDSIKFINLLKVLLLVGEDIFNS